MTKQPSLSGQAIGERAAVANPIDTPGTFDLADKIKRRAEPPLLSTFVTVSRAENILTKIGREFVGTRAIFLLPPSLSLSLFSFHFSRMRGDL